MKTYPKNGEPFELTTDGAVLKNTPAGMVVAFGYNLEGWQHDGRAIMGKQTRKFMLVTVGYHPNLAAAKQELEKQYGPTPEGQWIKVFNDEYPEPDGNGPVGIADSSWVDPDGLASFPCVRSRGKTDFYGAGRGLIENWRWLVPAPGK